MMARGKQGMTEQQMADFVDRWALRCGRRLQCFRAVFLVGCG